MNTFKTKFEDFRIHLTEIWCKLFTEFLYKSIAACKVLDVAKTTIRYEGPIYVNVSTMKF